MESFHSPTRFSMPVSSTTRESLSAKDRLLVEKCESFGSVNDCSVGPLHASLAASDTAHRLLFWFPSSVPVGSSISVASSRLSQKLDEHSDWFDALRTLAVRIAGEPSFLITASGTTADTFLRRLAELFQIRLLVFEPFPKSPGKRWFQEQFERAQGTEPETAYFKPLDATIEIENKLNVDDLLISIATTTVLLSVRAGGNVFNAALRRLDSQDKLSTRLLINRGLTKKPVETLLLKNGATAWWIYGQSKDTRNTATNQAGDRPTRVISRLIGDTNSSILTLDEVKTENYLLHWTRRRVGPWPDQTSSEYLDDLIFQTTRREHSELSALCRILAAGRILASNHLTRDPRAVVCFSELPLEEITERRTFRPHLNRWDFEPFGIAIDRELLQNLGAQPVIYGNESDWGQHVDQDRPFFQLRRSKSDQIDWELEREWRILGDLKLDEIPFDQAIVFVPSESAAEIVARLSRWPIVVLE